MQLSRLLLDIHLQYLIFNYFLHTKEKWNLGDSIVFMKYILALIRERRLLEGGTY